MYTFKRGLSEETDAVQKQYQAKVARMGDLEEKEKLLSIKQNEVKELKQEAGKKKTFVVCPQNYECFSTVNF